MTRRLLLCTLFAIVSISQTGCCGRVRSFFYRLTHCPPGGCGPVFPYAGAPVFPRLHPGYADVEYGGAMMDSAPALSAPPVMAGAPGCSTCYSGGHAYDAPPVIQGGIPSGQMATPIFNTTPITQMGPAVGNPIPTQMAPPSVAEPPKGSK